MMASLDSLERLLSEPQGGHVDLERILRLVGDELFHYARALTGTAEHAEDAVQDLLVALLEQQQKGKAILRPRAWLFSVLRRKALAQRKGSKKVSAPVLEIAVVDLDPEKRLMVQEALRGLNGVVQEIVLLRLWEGLEMTEISEVLDLPYGTALSHYHRGLQELRRRCGVEFRANEEGGHHGQRLAEQVSG